MLKLLFWPAILIILYATNTGQVMPIQADARVIVNLNREYQTIHSFGASDCWSAKFIGTWDDDAKKNQIADLLFSLDTLPDGQPKGIGLTLWRMNIGAGSFEQGTASNIGDEWRREACFQDAGGRYDWTKQAGSQWFLNAARQRGVPFTLGFANSPPVHMTINGKAFSPGGGSLNLKPDRLDGFADFLTDVSRHFGFTYVSPINEPQWDWKAGNNGKAGQEGSPAQNRDILAVAKALSDKLSAKKSKTTVVTGEAGQIDFLYGRGASGRGDQLPELFKKNGPSLRNLPNVAPVLAYHSYFSTCNDSTLVNTRRLAAQAARAVSSPALWQSEFGVLGNICNKLNGSPRHTDIDYGLYVANVLHHDLTLANVTSWQWWLAINPYNYSDGLVYVNGPDGGYKNHDNARLSGQVVDSKQLWAFGNYARFVRPGMKRIDVTLENGADPITQAGRYGLSAYKDEAAKKLVLVAVNLTDQTVTLPLSGVTVRGNHFTTYTTDRNRNVAKAYVSANTVRLEPKSVVTLVGNYE